MKRSRRAQSSLTSIPTTATRLSPTLPQEGTSVTRAVTFREMAAIESKLSHLRDAFNCWPTNLGFEWDLCRFAYYEGSDRHSRELAVVLGSTAPLALGRELVERYNCEWCIIESSSGPRIGVCHQSLDAPVDLFELDASPLLDPEEHDEDIDRFGPGEGAVESLFAITRQIREKLG